MGFTACACNMTSIPRLLLLSQTHKSFHYPELVSISKIFNFPPQIFPEDKSIIENNATVQVNLNDSQINQLLSRSMAIKNAFDLYSSGTTYQELFENLDNSDLFKQRYYHQPDQKLAFKVVAVNKKLSNDNKRQIQIYKDCFDRHPACQSQIDLNAPDFRLFFIEIYDENTHPSKKELRKVYWSYFGEKWDNFWGFSENFGFFAISSDFLQFLAGEEIEK